MTRYQTYQLSAFILVGIAASQLLSTLAALFNPQVGLIIFIPTLLGLIGWVGVEATKYLRYQDAGSSQESPENNLPFAILLLVLVIIGGLMGVLWTD